MERLNIPKLNFVSWVLSLPPILLAFHLIMYENRLWQDINIWLISIPLFTFLSFLSFYGHVQYGHWVENKYPDLADSGRRIFLKAMVQFFIMTPSIGLIFLLYHNFHILGYSFEKSHLFPGILVGLTVNIVFETLYEIDFIFKKYKESISEKEKIEQLSFSQEFDALKNQVNPHFLFNCFNTLSSLIVIDKNQADKFLNEMSKVYRYLLQNNEERMSTVESEIKFIQSYFQLLKTRHGDTIQLNVKIAKHHETYLLPSLTLQLLVENVVKHNALSKEKPLIIDIFTTEGNKLVVNNNKQKRAVPAISNKVGLKNIKEKYLILKQKGFHVIETESNFTVILPLIYRATLPNYPGGAPGEETVGRL